METRYTQLQSEERMTLASLHQQGWSLRAMGQPMGRSASTLSRELRRNATLRPNGQFQDGHTERRASCFCGSRHARND